jgi:hypothetical protein
LSIHLAACRGHGIGLAVLHPRKLAVYTVSAVGSSYLQLSKLYEHHLEHTAANMAAGPFGGGSGATKTQLQVLNNNNIAYVCSF